MGIQSAKVAKYIQYFLYSFDFMKYNNRYLIYIRVQYVTYLKNMG